MKKKFTLILLLCLLTALFLVGCADVECSHEWGEANVIDAPTCVKGGYSISTCVKCGETTRTILYPSDHPYSSEWSHDGSYHWRESTCQHIGQITDYAESHGLAYYNLIPKSAEIGLDMSADTYDAGAHLNVYGAEKLTRYFGAILRDTHEIPDRRVNSHACVVWEKRVDAYYARKTAMEAETLKS